MDAPAPPRGLAGHFVLRGRALAAGALIACVGTCASRPIPERSETAIASMLGGAIGGEVDPHDFVWEPSRGFFVDAFVGRRVLFLGKRGDAPRDLYRASVTLTHGGRPLSVRGVAPLVHTELADESELVARPDRAAVASLAFGRTQGVTVVELGASRGPGVRSVSRRIEAALEDVLGLDLAAALGARRVSFEHPPERASLEFQGGDLVLSFDGASSAVIDPTGKFSVSEPDPAGTFLQSSFDEPGDDEKASGARALAARFWNGDRGKGVTRTVPPWSPREAIANVDYAFPPRAEFQAIEGHEGASFVSKPCGEANVSLYAFDMRGLGARPVPGAIWPRSITAHASNGRIRSADRANVVAAIALPRAVSAGAWDAGILVAPLAADTFTIREFADVITAGAAPATAPSGTAIQYEADDGVRRAPRQMLCVTASGHLVVAWSAAATGAEMTASISDLQCAAASPASSGEPLGGAWVSADAAFVPWDPAMNTHFDAADGASPDSFVYLVHTAPAPSVAAPRGAEWVASPAPQPEPTSIPAIYEASADLLGTTIRLHLFMPHRFDWAYRAGDDEKSHRFKGTFPKVLDEADASRAFFAMGMGVGKRRNPNGLRIDGSTGHAFRGEGATLEVTHGGLRLALAHDEPQGDATELPLTVEGRALTSEARQRGPRQRVADLCVLGDGTVLLAEAEFENHEGTATLLAEMGCPLAVALDRGAERAAWSEDRSSDTLTANHVTTALYALGRAMPGSFSTAR